MANELNQWYVPEALRQQFAPSMPTPAAPNLAALQMAQQLFKLSSRPKLSLEQLFPVQPLRMRPAMDWNQPNTWLPAGYSDGILYPRPGQLATPNSSSATAASAALSNGLGYTSAAQGAAAPVGMRNLLAALQASTNSMIGRSAARTQAKKGAADYVKRQAELGVVADPASLVRMGVDPQTAKIMSEAASTRLQNEGSVGRMLGPMIGPDGSIKRGGGYVTAFGGAVPFQRNLSRDPMNDASIWRQMNEQAASVGTPAWTIPDSLAREAQALRADNLTRRVDQFVPDPFITSRGTAAMRYVNPERPNALASAMAAYNRMKAMKPARDARLAAKSKPAAAKGKVATSSATEAFLNSALGMLGGILGF